MLPSIRHALSILALLIWSAATAAQAAEPAPDAILKEAMREMVQQLNARRDAIARNPAIVQELAERILLPHVDFVAASRQVLGRHWRRASREQKLAFMREFRTLLLRFYSTALAKYLQDNTLDPAMFVFAP
ncbi:MAG TPA: ABC transporter substrate-binding protein, partial [Gammaproteobacteria bacterium]|nr:ABC transporter substrate-binding protein [Gammaproteobacteria bacterium]